jgi:hypothetical protein
LTIVLRLAIWPWRQFFKLFFENNVRNIHFNLFIIFIIFIIFFNDLTKCIQLIMFFSYLVFYVFLNIELLLLQDIKNAKNKENHIRKYLFNSILQNIKKKCSFFNNECWMFFLLIHQKPNQSLELSLFKIIQKSNRSIWLVIGYIISNWLV